MNLKLAVIAALTSLMVLALLLVGLVPSHSTQAIPPRNIAPEVCETNGTVTSAHRDNHLTYVDCSDGIVVLLWK